MKPRAVETRIAGTDVGASAVRLEITRGFSDGSIENVHQEWNPVRPAPGMYQTGVVPPAVVNRSIGLLLLRAWALPDGSHAAGLRGEILPRARAERDGATTHSRSHGSI